MNYEIIYSQCNAESRLDEKDLFKGRSPLPKTRKCKICGAHGDNVSLSPCGNKEYICKKCKGTTAKAKTGSEGKVSKSRAKKFGESVFDMDQQSLENYDSDLTDLIDAADELLSRTDAGTYTVVDGHLEFTIDTDFVSQFDEDAETYLKNYFEKFLDLPVVVTPLAEEEGFTTCEVSPVYLG